MKFIDELKRRNVIKATIAYIVVAWVLLQFFSIVLPNLEAPPWVLKTLMFVIAIVFPIWIIFSWVYELTPEGFKKTVKVSKEKSITAATNKRLNIIIIITLFIAIGVSFVNKPMSDTSLKTKVNTDLILDNSIAIIPFKNLSDNLENQYFADGMMDDILNHLSKIQGLEVKSRQSSERYRDSNKSIIEIGEELGAANILGGSVQKFMDSIKIIVQLVDAKNDNQLWSEKYDFELKNVFAIQSEISKQIAIELNTVISPTVIEEIEKRPTENLEAYNLYLKGRFFWHRRTEEDLNKGIYYFNQAIKLDSTYALAYTGLADSYLVMPWYKQVKDKDSVYNLSKKNALKALSIDKNNAETHATLGGVLCYKDWKWEASEKEFKLAIKLNPNYATAHQYYAELLQILGRFKEAREQIDVALKLNPNSYIMLQLSAGFYLNDGLFEKAIIEANKVQELNKNSFGSSRIIRYSYEEMGMDNEAMAEWEEFNKIDPSPFIIENIEVLRNAFKKSGIEGFYKAWIDAWLKKNKESEFPIQFAEIYSFLGEKEKAIELLELAYEQRDHAIIHIKTHLNFKNLRNEPRFLALLKKMKLGDYQ